MDIRYIANTFVVTTDLDIEELAEVTKGTEGSVVLKDSKGNDTFALDIDLSENKPLHEHYVVVNAISDGKAAIKFSIPAEVEEDEKKEYAAGILSNYWEKINAVLEEAKTLIEKKKIMNADILELMN